MPDLKLIQSYPILSKPNPRLPHPPLLTLPHCRRITLFIEFIVPL